jgi:glucose-6-phosphate-specific signal transduction histidine kinase
LNVKVLCSFRIVTARKLIIFCVSFFIVNLILGVRLLKELKTSCMFVVVSL